MDHSDYVQKRLLLKRNFETFMKSDMQSEDTRISMQLFNRLVTESWEHTTKKNTKKCEILLIVVPIINQ